MAKCTVEKYYSGMRKKPHNDVYNMKKDTQSHDYNISLLWRKRTYKSIVRGTNTLCWEGINWKGRGREDLSDRNDLSASERWEWERVHVPKLTTADMWHLA